MSAGPLEMKGHRAQSTGRAQQTEAAPLCLREWQQGGRERTAWNGKAEDPSKIPAPVFV